MGEKTVTLSAYEVRKLEEFREINDKYEKVSKETSGIELSHLEDDNALIYQAICIAIDEYSDRIKKREGRKAEVTP